MHRIETVILLHPPLPLAGVSIEMEREHQQCTRSMLLCSVHVPRVRPPSARLTRRHRGRSWNAHRQVYVLIADQMVSQPPPRSTCLPVLSVPFSAFRAFQCFQCLSVPSYLMWLLFVQGGPSQTALGGGPSKYGELFYCEAPTITGPWKECHRRSCSRAVALRSVAVPIATMLIHPAHGTQVSSRMT